MRRPVSTSILFVGCLVFLALLSLSSLGPGVEGSQERVQAEIAQRRAKISDEELKKQIESNTLSDADMLPTVPPPKEWKPSGKPEVALILAPGLGLGCNLKWKYPNLREFLMTSAKYWPELHVEYTLNTDPKLKFYPDATSRSASLIHGESLSAEQLLEILQQGPDEAKEPLLSMELKGWDPETKEIEHYLELHGLKKSPNADEDHSSQLIFKPDFKPIEG